MSQKYRMRSRNHTWADLHAQLYLLATYLYKFAMKDHMIPTQKNLSTSGEGWVGYLGYPGEEVLLANSLDALMSLEGEKAGPVASDG